MDMTTIGLIAIISLFALMLVGIPIAFSLGIVSLVLIYFVWPGPSPFSMLYFTSWNLTHNFILATVPLFILLGEIILFSGLASDVFDVASKWVGRLPGGLAVAGIFGCAGFAAVSGSSVANTATNAMVAVPEMLKRGYSKKLAPGCIAAGGALGILIPPSIPMILYATMAEESIGQLFFGGMIPGVMTALIFAVYIVIRCSKDRSFGPPSEKSSWGDKFGSLWKMLPLLALIGGVLGTVYLGVCTPSESAAVGALGALIIAFAYRKLNRRNLTGALLAAIKTNAMIIMIFIGGLLFSHVLSFMGLSKLVVNAVLELEVNRWVIMIGLNLLLLVLGCFIDPGSIIIIVTPLALPVILNLGFDPIWFGIIFTINMEMANITPPLGYNLYVLKGVVPAEVKLQDIILGMLPFLGLFALSLAIVMIFPQLALWLPRMMIK